MWKNIYLSAKELLFPKRCLFCQKRGVLLCVDCQELLDVARQHRHDRHHKYLADVYAACSYENKFAQKIIHRLKYKPFSRELSLSLARLITNHCEFIQQVFDPGEFVLAYVPLAKRRLRWRGFNQAELIAKDLGKIWQISVAADCLKRIRETQNQAELSQPQRRENVKGAFVCTDNSPFKNKSVLLVDDVATTCATMEECARVLLKNGARQVIGVAAARTENS